MWCKKKEKCLVFVLFLFFLKHVFTRKEKEKFI